MLFRSACPIPAGTVVTEQMLCVKRPGFGIAPKHLEAVVGRVARCDIDDDEILMWEMF